MKQILPLSALLAVNRMYVNFDLQYWYYIILWNEKFKMSVKVDMRFDYLLCYIACDIGISSDVFRKFGGSGAEEIREGTYCENYNRETYICLIFNHSVTTCYVFKVLCIETSDKNNNDNLNVYVLSVVTYRNIDYFGWKHTVYYLLIMWLCI